MKKLFRYTNKRPIWRILISNGKILIEEREAKKKQVFYNCIDGYTGKALWKNKQFLSESYWIGIESLTGNYLILHKFLKPDLPIHREIIVIDMLTSDVIWTNSDLTFYSQFNNSILAYSGSLDNPKYFELDLATGEIIKELSTEQVMNKLATIDQEDKYKLFKFAEFVSDTDSEENQSLISNLLKEKEIIGKTEQINLKEKLILGYHQKDKKRGYNNILIIYDKIKEKIIYSDYIILNSMNIVPDSFFIYDKALFYIKERTALISLLI